MEESEFNSHMQRVLTEECDLGNTKVECGFNNHESQ